MKHLIVSVFFISLIVPVWADQTEQDLFREAEDRFLGGDYALALDLYNEFLDEYPLSEYVPNIQFRKAVALYRTGRSEEAFDLFTLIQQRYRSTSYLHLVPFWKGLLRFEEEQYEEAIEFFTAFLNTGSETLIEETLLYLGIACEKTGRVENAREYLSRLLETRSPEEEPYAFTLLCSLLIKSEMYEDLLHHLEGVDTGAFRADFADRLILYRAEGLWNTGSVDDAVAQYERVLKASPEISSLAFQRLFSYLRKTGDDEALQNLLDRAERTLAGRLDVLTGFWLRIGVESFKEEKYDLAGVYLQRIWNALERGSVDPLVPLYLSQLYSLRENPSRGIQVLEEYRAAGAPEDDYILFQLSRLYIGLEQWEQTETTCRRFLDIFPQSPRAGEVSYRLAFSLYRRDNLQEALRVAQSALTGGTARQERSKLLKLAATIQRKLGRDTAARETLEEYNALNPSDLEAVLHLAELAFKEREYSTVVGYTADLEKETGRRGILADYLAGLSLIPSREYSRALERLDSITPEGAEAVGLEDIYPYVLFYRGWVHYRLAEYAPALQEFENLTTAYPGFSLSPEALYLAGWCAFSMGDYGKSLGFFGGYAGKAPEDRRDRGRYMYAKSYIAAGRYDEAAAVLRNMYTESPASSFADDALFEHAGIMENTGKNDEAARLYAELPERYPDSPFGEESLFRRAEVLYRQKKWHEARNAFYTVRASYPDGELFDAALYWGGMASLMAREPFGAVLLWEKLIREYPDSGFRPEALYKTAEVYRESGDYAKAFSLYRELTSAYPEDSRAAPADRTAEELVYLLQGQEEREADLMVTINRSGGAADPDGREAMIELARLYLYRGGKDREKVPGLLEEVISRRGEDLTRAARAQYYLGEYYFRSNDLSRAWKEFLAAATMNPEDKDLMAMSLFRGVQVAVTAGKMTEARQLAQRLRNHFPDSSWTVEAERILEERQ